MMAGLTMSAFFIEASINYVGAKKIKGWDEGANGWKKLKKVLGEFGLTPDLDSRPWSVIARLKAFRNTLAHGKPEKLTASRTVEGPVGTPINHEPLKSEWEGELTAQSVVECYEDANIVSLALFEAAGIKPLKAVSGGSAEITYHGPPIQGTGFPEGWKGTPKGFRG